MVKASLIWSSWNLRGRICASLHAGSTDITRNCGTWQPWWFISTTKHAYFYDAYLTLAFDYIMIYTRPLANIKQAGEQTLAEIVRSRFTTSNVAVQGGDGIFFGRSLLPLQMSKYPSHLFTTNISLNHFLLMKKFGLYMCRFPTSYPKIPVRQCHGRPELIATILDNAHNSRTNDKMNTIRASQQKQAGTALLIWNVSGGSWRRVEGGTKQGPACDLRRPVESRG